jgi:hypothetical protein
MNDIPSVICIFSNKNDLLNLLSVSKLFNFFDHIFTKKYFIGQEKIKNSTVEFLSKIRLITNVSTIDKLPQFVTSIQFSNYFNQCIDKLHQSATYGMGCI